MADRRSVPGSQRTPVPGARLVGQVDPAERVEVTVVLRPGPDQGARRTVLDQGTQPVRERSHVSREEFAATSGADPAHLERVADFARTAGLEVVQTSAPRRSVRLAGSARAMSEAFGVELSRYDHPAGTFRGRVGPVYVPAALADIVQAVLGLDERPQAQTRFRVAAVGPRAVTALTAAQLARLYDFPPDLDGSGECIAIIELGGGYSEPDLQTYFADLGIAVPTVVAVGVDGATNTPTGAPDGPDGEVMLDIEVAGAVAPGARIAVYFAPNTDAGFLDAVTTALHDTSNAPSVMSISWGAAESDWTAQAAEAMDAAFTDAAQLGVTVLAASGDNGSSDRVDDGLAHADFPASSPHVLGCGGTVLDFTTAAISSESVWNDGRGGASGGGVSDLFDVPDFQSSADVPPSVNPGGRTGRGVPDVCGNADPASGYQVVVAGQPTVIGGTSAVSPLWAGLIACLNQALGTPVGYLNPLLYAGLSAPVAVAAAVGPDPDPGPGPGPGPAGGLVDIVAGDNRVASTAGYDARPGWDACTGLGRPDGAALLAALST